MTNSELEGKGVSNSNGNWLVKLHFFDIVLKNMESARNRLLQSFCFIKKSKQNPSALSYFVCTDQSMYLCRSL